LLTTHSRPSTFFLCQNSNPNFSQTRDRYLFPFAKLTRCIAFRREADFGNADFSLCAFPRVRKSKPHRLKPVLPGRTGPLLGNGPTASAKFWLEIPANGRN
jgi:hypothetical protein